MNEIGRLHKFALGLAIALSCGGLAYNVSKYLLNCEQAGAQKLTIPCEINRIRMLDVTGDGIADVIAECDAGNVIYLDPKNCKLSAIHSGTKEAKLYCQSGRHAWLKDDQGW